MPERDMKVSSLGQLNSPSHGSRRLGSELTRRACFEQSTYRDQYHLLEAVSGAVVGVQRGASPAKALGLHPRQVG